MATPQRPAVQRPLSPHLQIYKPQLTSALSIIHRITGVFLAVTSLGLVWFLLAVAAGPEAFDTFASVAASLPGQLVLFAMTATISLHLLNGLRHLMWDAGKGLDIPSVYRSGYAVIVLAIVLTAVVWAFALGGGA